MAVAFEAELHLFFDFERKERRRGLVDVGRGEKRRSSFGFEKGRRVNHQALMTFFLV